MNDNVQFKMINVDTESHKILKNISNDTGKTIKHLIKESVAFLKDKYGDNDEM